jgi:hypothetical protein
MISQCFSSENSLQDVLERNKQKKPEWAQKSSSFSVDDEGIVGFVWRRKPSIEVGRRQFTEEVKIQFLYQVYQWACVQKNVRFRKFEYLCDAAHHRQSLALFCKIWKAKSNIFDDVYFERIYSPVEKKEFVDFYGLISIPFRDIGAQE